MEKIIFTKMSGAGNDFVFIDKQLNPNLSIDSEFVQKICDRRNGIGADGLITIEDSSDYNFIMNYFNADGSTGSLCANGARCAIRFAEDSGRVNNNKAEFLSNGVKFNGEITTESEVRFYLNSPKKIKYNFKVKAGAKLLTAHFADTGSPHVIIDIKESEGFLQSLEDVPVKELGREIRNLPEFKANGVNVNFIDIRDNVIRIRTYERGVEDETLSCGTGVTAAAIAAHYHLNHFKNKTVIDVKTQGGNLQIKLQQSGQGYHNIWLCGPAQFVFSGTIHI